MKIGPFADKPVSQPATPAAASAKSPARSVATSAATPAATSAATPAAIDAGRSPASAAVAKPPGVDASATIQLSTAASSLLTTGVAAEFDAGKVARMSAAIDNGSFRINPEAIADKLITNAQELLTQVKG